MNLKQHLRPVWKTESVIENMEKAEERIVNQGLKTKVYIYV